VHYKKITKKKFKDKNELIIILIKLNIILKFKKIIDI